MKANNLRAALEQQGWIFVRTEPLIYDRLSGKEFIDKLVSELRGMESTKSIEEIINKVNSTVDKMKNAPLTQIDQLIKNDYEKRSAGEFFVTDAYDENGNMIANMRAVYRK